MILPKVWPDSNKRPVCVHLAGTGDHVRKPVSYENSLWCLEKLDV